MAKVVLLSDQMPDLLPMKRTPGVHLSRIVHHLCLDLGHYPEREGPPPRAMFELGNAIEHAVAERLALDDPGRFIRPGEILHDGILCTPDLYDVQADADEEIKLAWMSARHGPMDKKLWRWRVQIMGYCWALGTVTGRMRAFFVRGDYGDELVAYRRWEYTFTRSELAENWLMLKNYAKENPEKCREG